jgi:hypothetical protein
VATVGLIVWTFLPPSAARLYERGTALMSSDDTDDWEKALEVFEELDQRHPDHPHQEAVAVMRKKAEAARERRQEARNARLAGPMSEAHWFYEQGLRLRQQGKTKEAEELWRRLIDAFGDVAAEEPWVERARKELEKPSGRERTGDERWESVRKALAQAAALEKEGKAAEARTIRDSLRRLYADDPSARATLPELFKKAP